jgi:hypothetical protein
MRKIRLILALNVAAAVWCGPAHGQTNSSTQPATPQPSMADTVREFDRMLANSDQLHRSTLPTSKAPKSVAPVLSAIPQFRKATAELREAVGAQQNVRLPLQSLGKLIKPFSEYFKELNLKPRAPDVQELKGYTQKDLLWETLTTAERVDNNLQIANKLIRESNNSGAISIKAMQFYLEIDTDLKRLKLLADKVQTNH